MKVTYLDNGIRYRRICDNICFEDGYIGLIYYYTDNIDVIWLKEKEIIIEKIED